MSSSTQKILIFVLPVVIIVAIAVTVKRAGVKKDPGIEFTYTVYAIGEDENIYVFEFSGPGLAWPVRHGDQALFPLYGCTDCGALFAGSARGVTAVCPDCYGQNVGMYSPDLHEAVEAEEVRAEDLELPGDS